MRELQFYNLQTVYLCGQMRFIFQKYLKLSGSMPLSFMLQKGFDWS